MPSYLARQYFNGDGSTTVWEFAFQGVNPDASSGTTPYLEPGDIKTFEAIPTNPYQPDMLVEVAHVLTGANTLAVTPPIPIGHKLLIQRQTQDLYNLVNFQNLQVVQERDLDEDSRQCILLVQEALDEARNATATASELTLAAVAFFSATGGGFKGGWNMNSGLPVGVGPNDMLLVTSPLTGHSEIAAGDLAIIYPTINDYVIIPGAAQMLAVRTEISNIDTFIDGIPAMIAAAQDAATIAATDAAIAAVADAAAAAEAAANNYTDEALTAYAPLANPALTGSPTAPTPTFSSNNTLIATTAFAKSLMGFKRGFFTEASALPVYPATLVNYMGWVYRYSGPLTITTNQVYLPDANSVAAGAQITLVHNSVSALQIGIYVVLGGIWSPGVPGISGGNPVVNCELNPGEAITLVSDGVANWYIVDRTAESPYTLGSDGSSILAGGLHLRWGSGSTAHDGDIISFADPFPNTCFQVIGSGSLGTAIFGADVLTKTGFTLHTQAASINYRYFAIGN